MDKKKLSQRYEKEVIAKWIKISFFPYFTLFKEYADR